MRALAAAAALAAPAGAEPPATDPAIGRLNRGGTRVHHCTAALVAPREALTARHCVANVPVEDLHLVLGWERGTYAEHLRVASVVASDVADIARLCLDGPARTPPLATDAAPPAAGVVGVTGYPGSRAHLQDERLCWMEPGSDGAAAVAALGCPLEGGFSGGPVRGPGPDGPVIGVAFASSATGSLAALLGALPPDADCPAP